MELIDHVAAAVARHRLLDPGSACVIAVSGGLDSMCLLHVLSRLAPASGWQLSVAHFDHQLRSGSPLDEALVRAEAARLGLPFHAEAGDVRAHARAAGLSLEMAGRELRQRFLVQTAREAGAHRVALAHHRDDQIETVWLRLLRGVVGAGLGGMRWQNPSPADPGVVLVRPLLEVRRAELAEFQKREAIPFREDESNAELRFQRNRVRHELLPLLRSIQPAIDEHTLRWAESAAAEHAVVRQAAQQWREARAPKFAGLPAAVQRTIVHDLLLETGLRPEFDLIERLRTTPDTWIMLDTERRIRRLASGELEIAAAQPSLAFATDSQTVPISAGKATFGGRHFSWRIEPPGATTLLPGQERFDAESIGGTLTLRHWTPGDRFHPIGLPSSAKLQDLFTNLKIPAEERRRLVVAEDARGRIFWVESLRVSECHKVSPATTRMLVWSWRTEAAEPNCR